MVTVMIVVDFLARCWHNDESDETRDGIPFSYFD